MHAFFQDLSSSAREEGDALLAGILADPGDDTLRSIYADWCEEAGVPAHPARLAMMRGVKVKLSRALSWHHVFPEVKEFACTLLPQSAVLADGREVRKAQGGAGGHFGFRKGFLERVPARLSGQGIIWMAGNAGRQSPAAGLRWLARLHPLHLDFADDHYYFCAARAGGWVATDCFVPQPAFALMRGSVMPKPSEHEYGGRWYASLAKAEDDIERAFLAWSRLKS